MRRVGRAPDPWAWTDWRWAERGHFGGRWDDVDDVDDAYRTVYVGATEFACFVEVLAKFRRHTEVSAAVAAVRVSDADEALYPTERGGVLDVDWPDGRLSGVARLDGQYCFVTHSESVSALRALFATSYEGLLDERDFTAALLKEAERRDVTQRVSRILYDYQDEERERLDGIEFLSRHGDDLRMWAVFERTQEVRSPGCTTPRQLHSTAHTKRSSQPCATTAWTGRTRPDAGPASPPPAQPASAAASVTGSRQTKSRHT